ncbi:MAG: orotate phosphoribosyltransferase [Spirochaetes bacterium GWF1_51_8]|nr:MAG: orotate phosphoribosyltransferase [Spirochaetes bacterium GWF1_51_8]
MREIREDKGIEDLLNRSEALLTGHFILSSGLHSDKYVQCAKYLQYPEMAEVAGKKLARLFADVKINVVIGGAFGGIIIAYELARALHARGVFAERVDGVFQLRRGFEIRPGEKVLIAEDVITTGKSVKEVMDLVAGFGAEIIGAASLIDRNMAESESLGIRTEWLHSVQAHTYDPSDCPLCKEGNLPAVKPGSRGVSQK